MENKFIDKVFTIFIKQAEKLIADNGALAKLIDKGFEKLEAQVNKFYTIQDSILAVLKLLRAWLYGDYKEISYFNVVSLVAATIYFVSPLDLIPDFIPFIGKLDDVFVLNYIIKTLNKEIERFMAWENARQASV
ncbi:MAG: DUF1232 domain-containing protein [Chitinophagales bacterium]|nr:DUF1232 domain-containing protein [Chitinophagales bacterium]